MVNTDDDDDDDDDDNNNCLMTSSSSHHLISKVIKDLTTSCVLFKTLLHTEEVSEIMKQMWVKLFTVELYLYRKLTSR